MAVEIPPHTPAAEPESPGGPAAPPAERTPPGEPPHGPPHEPPPPPRGRRRRRLVAGVAAVALVTASVTAGVVLTRRSPSSSGAPSPTPAPIATAPAATPSPAPLPTVAPSSSAPPSAVALDPATVAARVTPAVVNIDATLGPQETASGTGMVLTSSGEVLTNNHVVQGATSVTAQVAGSGPRYRATVIGVDPTDDVALIQLAGASGLPVVPLGNSSTVAVGDPVVVVGNARGLGGTPAWSTGVVTGLDQTITASDANGSNAETLTGMIRVQADIQPGDSGGPIVDASARVIAMTTAGSARVHRSGAIGFGIPVNTAMTIAGEIQRGQGPNVLPGQRGVLGVRIDASRTAAGALVVSVDAGSPAAGAGMAAGDLIITIDGTVIDSADSLSAAMLRRRPGETVTVTWVDASASRRSARITLAAGPPA